MLHMACELLTEPVLCDLACYSYPCPLRYRLDEFLWLFLPHFREARFGSLMSYWWCLWNVVCGGGVTSLGIAKNILQSP